MASCGCRTYQTRNGDQETDRCADHDYSTVTCRLCAISVPEDAVIGDRVCETCAELHGLCACDGCGRVLPLSASVERKEISETGRIMTYRYCHPCEREIMEDAK